MGEAAAVALEILKQTSGLEAARQLYRQMLKLPPAGGSLFHAILDMEEAALPSSDCLSEPQLTQLYEVRDNLGQLKDPAGRFAFTLRGTGQSWLFSCGSVYDQGYSNEPAWSCV